MYLDVNWKNGEVTHIPLAQSHTLQIIADGKVQDAFSFDGVASLTLNLDGAPAATDPIPPANEGAAEGATEDPTPPAETASDTLSNSATDHTLTGDEPAPSGDPHADAVAAAETSVAAAVNIAGAPDVAPADKQLQVQTALADVESALAEWPESEKLLDAKAQLEALAGELAS